MSYSDSRSEFLDITGGHGFRPVDSAEAIGRVRFHLIKVETDDLLPPKPRGEEQEDQRPVAPGASLLIRDKGANK
jgi:hypothetical protein